MDGSWLGATSSVDGARLGIQFNSNNDRHRYAIVSHTCRTVLTRSEVSLWVQSFYIWRIYALGKGLLVWKVIVGLIMAARYFLFMSFIAPDRTRQISLTQSITSIYVGIRVSARNWK